MKKIKRITIHSYNHKVRFEDKPGEQTTMQRSSSSQVKLLLHPLDRISKKNIVEELLKHVKKLEHKLGNKTHTSFLINPNQSQNKSVITIKPPLGSLPSIDRLKPKMTVPVKLHNDFNQKEGGTLMEIRTSRNYEVHSQQPSVTETKKRPIAQHRLTIYKPLLENKKYAEIAKRAIEKMSYTPDSDALRGNHILKMKCKSIRKSLDIYELVTLRDFEKK